jgi:ELWxxDGT repeat protein
MDTNSGEVILIKDINPGFSEYFPRSSDPAPLDPDRPYSPPPSTVPNNSFPSSLVEFKDKLYFAADNGENGSELYVSDGTGSGTQLVVDLRPGENKYGEGYSSSPFYLTEFENKLYFTANDGEVGNELFVSDGTAAGTQLLADLRPGSTNYGPNGSYAGNLVEFKDKLYFTANDGEVGNELFVSDGTAAGTQLVADLRPGNNDYGNTNGSYPSNLVEFKNKLYFAANDGEVGNELFVSDGTAAGTQLVADLNPGEDEFGNINGSYPRELIEFNDKLYFSANNSETGNELYVSDGTAAGTQLLVDINPGINEVGNVNSSDPSNFIEFAGKLYFAADDGTHGSELFVSDGTAEGTQLLVDINQGEDSSGDSYSSFPSNFVEFNDKLYFTANDEVNGTELFVSDGTAAGTQLLADIKPGLNNYGFPNSSNPSDLEVVGDELFFAADDIFVGRELFKLSTDGFGEETFLPVDGFEGEDILF